MQGTKRARAPLRQPPPSSPAVTPDNSSDVNENNTSEVESFENMLVKTSVSEDTTEHHNNDGLHQIGRFTVRVPRFSLTCEKYLGACIDSSAHRS